MQRNLTESDRKEIKHMTRIGFVLPGLILGISVIINLLFLVDKNDNTDFVLLTFIDLGIIAICLGISYLMNRKYYQDLKLGVKKIRLEKVQDKENKTSYEAGSGTLHKPFLGKLFPKLWSQEMKPIFLVYLIINNTRYEVKKTLYDKVKNGDYVEMHYSEFSKTLLTIENSRKNASG